jgi:hypothetical protein
LIEGFYDSGINVDVVSLEKNFILKIFKMLFLREIFTKILQEDVAYLKENLN